MSSSVGVVDKDVPDGMLVPRKIIPGLSKERSFSVHLAVHFVSGPPILRNSLEVISCDTVSHFHLIVPSTFCINKNTSRRGFAAAFSIRKEKALGPVVLVEEGILSGVAEVEVEVEGVEVEVVVVVVDRRLAVVVYSCFDSDRCRTDNFERHI